MRIGCRSDGGSSGLPALHLSQPVVQLLCVSLEVLGSVLVVLSLRESCFVLGEQRSECVGRIECVGVLCGGCQLRVELLYGEVALCQLLCEVEYLLCCLVLLGEQDGYIVLSVLKSSNNTQRQQVRQEAESQVRWTQWVAYACVRVVL